MKVGRSSTYLLAGLLLAACSSGDDGGSSHGSRSEIASQQSALTGSSTLQAAVAGKIVAPPSGPISTGMPGAPSVGDDGSASYRIPIWVPDGVNGLQPDLALEYNSEAATGLLGPRWRLTGLSTISRCPKTRAQDGVQTAVNFRDSVFCLDGQRMVVVGTIDATRTEFRTERDAFVKIVGFKDTTLNQYYKFTAYQKDGLISSFGTTALSRLHGNPRSWAGGWQEDVNYAYYVDKIQDRYGNAINITYQNGIASPASGKTEVQELQPSTITWGPASVRSVTFGYEGITGALNPQVRYVSGLGIGMATHMTTILVKGPDGSNLPPPILKEYKLTYDTNARPVTGGPQTIITGDRVLSTITECDGTQPTPICKKPTKLQWSAGSTGYSEVNLGTAIPDLFKDVRGTLLGVDLNSDGFDDVVYRSFVPPHHTNYNDCFGWQSRLNNGSGQSSMFGSATPLPLNADPDPSCLADVISSTEHQRYRDIRGYAGDVLFADLNGDSYPDILSPIGTKYDPGDNTLVSVMVGYRAYLSQSGASFGTPVNFLDSIGQLPSNNQGYNFVWSNLKHAALSVNDIDGDGFLDIIRPNQNPPQTLSAARIWSGALTAKTQTRNNNTFNYSECATTTAGCKKPIANVLFPDDSTTFKDVAAVDLDGDGTAEIIRSATSCAGLPCGNMKGIAAITSPTTNVIVNFPNKTGDTRRFMDLNGDGLQDLVWSEKVVVGNSSTDRFWGSINSGQGFLPEVSTTVTPLDQSDSAYGTPMVMDYNLDGRQDLLLGFWMLPAYQQCVEIPPPGCTTCWCSGWKPTHPYNFKVLLSDGKGGFTEQATNIPLAQAQGRSVVDLNGDGLPDTLQVDMMDKVPVYPVTVPPSNASALRAHIRGGTAPLMLLDAYEGNGRLVSFNYAPANKTDPTFYSSNRSTSCDTDATHLECLNHGRWLAKSLTISSNGTDGGQAIQPITENFSYFNGVSDKEGRGFLGFTSRTIKGPGSRKTTITYDPLTRRANGSKYAYPYAMLPKTVSIDTDTPQTLDAPQSHYLSQQSTTYTAATSVWRSNGTYAVFPLTIDSYNYHCWPSSPLGSCGSSPTMLGYQKATDTYDTYGNLTSHTVKFYDAANTLLRTDTGTNRFQAADLGSWLVALPDPANPNTQRSVVGTEDVTRTVKITPDMRVNSVTTLKVGVVESVEFEPNGTDDVRLRRTFGRNQTTGQVTSVSDAASFPSISGCTTTCSGSCTPSCQSGCGAGPGQSACISACMNNCMNNCVQGCSAPREVRTTNFTYDDGVDGVHLTTTTYPPTNSNLVMKSRVWRHPGLGLPVEWIGVDGLAATQTYDTFGRPLTSTSKIGASVVNAYASGSSNGLDMTIKPEGLSTRAITVHYDSWGRETSRNSPIDSTRSLGQTQSYDHFGRLAQRTLTGLNTYTYGYDDLGRPTSVCHLTPNNSTGCETHSYNGLAEDIYDEQLYHKTKKVDAMGRLAIDGAQGELDASFTYGAFGVLKQERTADGVGQTDFTYDVRGRRKTITRRNTGTRGKSYNAFGEISASYKLRPDGTAVDQLNYARDKLGRVTSITTSNPETTSVPVNRSFVYDGLSSQAYGKIVDAVDTTNGNQTVHFEYDAGKGLVQSKTWTLSLNGGPRTNYGTMRYNYDLQGRLWSMSYPTPPGWSDPLSVLYEYDIYNGEVSKILGLSFEGVLWQPTARNSRGQITQESVSLPGAPTRTRNWSYAPQTGDLLSGNLMNGAGASASFSYRYFDNGLPREKTVTGSSTTVSSFSYDHLSRLTNWTPNTGAPAVAYTYDSDGNLATRTLGSSESVSYSTAPSTRIAAFNTGRVNYFDYDVWGRTYDTPESNLTYNAADEVVNVFDEDDWVNDPIVLDAFGNRVATLFDADSIWTGRYRLTFDGLYQFSNLATTEERCRVVAGGRVVGDLVRTSNSGARTATYYLLDKVGTVLAEMNSAGTVTPRRMRDPFGNQIDNPQSANLPNVYYVASDSTSGSRLAFAGHDADGGFGLIDMGARYYSGVLGRFMSPDPVILNAADRRDYNPYAYARNNPVALNDPTGNFAEGDTLAFGGECGNCGGGEGDGGGSDTGGGSTYPDQGVAPAEESKGGGSSSRPSDTFIEATGKVPYSNKSSKGGLSSSNYALRSHGPTDGNATLAGAAGVPWSCGLRAKEAKPRLEDERDALAIHNYLMAHDGVYEDEYLLKTETMHGIGTEAWFAITTLGAGAALNAVKGGIGMALSSQGLRALLADTAGGGPNPFLLGRAALVRGQENIFRFASLNEARAAARQMAGLGDDAVKYISEVGPMRGQVVGSASRDGLRGWRIDFDPAKGGHGYHVNWWNHTGGLKRSSWYEGANIIEGKGYGDFLNLLQHMQ